jgi:hypothetical protein
MAWDPSKHPRKPAGSSVGGEFSVSSAIEKRKAAAETRRGLKAHKDSMNYEHLIDKMPAADIAAMAGYPYGHEQHWAFHNGLTTIKMVRAGVVGARLPNNGVKTKNF